MTELIHEDFLYAPKWGLERVYPNLGDHVYTRTMVRTTQFVGYTNGESVNISFYMHGMDFKEVFFCT